MRRVRPACIAAWCCVMLLSAGLAVPAQAAPRRPSSDLNPAPTRLILGADGALWFTEHAGNRIGRLTLSGAFSFYTVPTPRSGPTDLAAAGRYIWFTEQARAALGRLDTTSGAIAEFPCPRPGSWPSRLVVGARRRHLVHRDARQSHRASRPDQRSYPRVPAAGRRRAVWHRGRAGRRHLVYGEPGAERGADRGGRHRARVFAVAEEATPGYDRRIRRTSWSAPTAALWVAEPDSPPDRPPDHRRRAHPI